LMTDRNFKPELGWRGETQGDESTRQMGAASDAVVRLR
jgi:hypothetical protein